jgi:hypothetical protein
MPDARIAALADAGLDLVPGYKLDPDTHKESPTWRADYFRWYEQVRDWLPWAQHKFATDTEFRHSTLKLCERDSAFFTLLFMQVEEPRSMEYFDQTGVTLTDALASLHDPTYEIAIDDLSYRTIHPFIPFAYQVDAHHLLTKVILGPMRGFYHDVLFDKARGIGMSYAFLAWAYWAWTFIPGLRGTILTEKWDKAERAKDINSLFGKLDLFLDATPDILIPADFKGKGEKDAHRLKGALVNPKNGAALFTEPTTADSTRGGREAFVGIDEIAFHEYLDETWATCGGTTKHRIGWSSANYRYGRQAERKFKNGRDHPTACTVKTLDWYENPHQDTRWYEAERERFRAAGQEEQFEVEYLRNAAAGSGRLVYKAQLNLARWTSEGYDKTKPLKMSVDPSSGADKTAFVFWQTHPVEDKKVIRWIEACALDKVPVQFWAYVMTGYEPRPAMDGEPPDDMYAYLREGFFEQSNIRSVMDWMRNVSPHSIMLYGDPAMKRRDVTHESWISVFERETLRIRRREFGADSPNAIPIFCNLPWEILTKRNNFHDRRVGMREALTYAEFSKGSTGVAELYEALDNTMFQEITERSTRGPGHIHDLGSDLTTAAEFGMVFETLKLTPQELQAPRLAKIEQPKSVKRVPRKATSAYQQRKRDNQRDSLVGLF